MFSTTIVPLRGRRSLWTITRKFSILVGWVASNVNAANHARKKIKKIGNIPDLPEGN